MPLIITIYFLKFIFFFVCTSGNLRKVIFLQYRCHLMTFKFLIPLHWYLSLLSLFEIFSTLAPNRSDVQCWTAYWLYFWGRVPEICSVLTSLRLGSEWTRVIIPTKKQNKLMFLLSTNSFSQNSLPINVCQVLNFERKKF